MLNLILSYGNVGCLVQQDIRGLQDGVGEQAEAEILVIHLCALRDVACSREFGLPRRHPIQFAKRRNAVENPRKFGMLGHLILMEDRTAMRIQPDSKERSHHFGSFRTQSCGDLRHGDGVVSDNAEVQRIRARGRGCILKVDPITKRSEIVAEMRDTGRLDTGEDDSWS